MNDLEQECALLIFIKNAEKGKVKTRLAATVGDDKALAIYLALLKHTREISQPLPIKKQLFYSQKIEETDDWPADHFEKALQIKGDLGAKMTAAFAHAFESYQKVVIIGSDCATLTEDLLIQAFTALSKRDFVIGPALDGGYYLLGMRVFTPKIFEGIEWSTEQVLPATINKIEGWNKSYTLLPTLSDIDYEADWKQYGWEIS